MKNKNINKNTPLGAIGATGADEGSPQLGQGPPQPKESNGVVRTRYSVSKKKHE